MVESCLLTVAYCIQISETQSVFYFSDEPWYIYCPNRKSLLLATGILVVGGTAAYVQSRHSSKKPDSFGYSNGLKDNNDKLDKQVTDEYYLKKTIQNKGSLKPLHVLAAVLLSDMGKMGARDLFTMVAIAVSLCSLCSHLLCFPPFSKFFL